MLAMGEIAPDEIAPDEGDTLHINGDIPKRLVLNFTLDDFGRVIAHKRMPFR